MFNRHRNKQFAIYNSAKKHFVDNYHELINLEHYLSEYLVALLKDNIDEISRDYDEASKLYPFWQNYPPDKRGRSPRGDQFPWIEVGEHAIGDKLPRLISKDFKVSDPGLPTGADKRFLLKNDTIYKITSGYTNAVWLFIDIKSVGPRDDFEHTVMSHNQISGDGTWSDEKSGVTNSIMIARGKRAQHNFHCSIPPLYVLSDETIAPAIIIAIKPVYSMLSMGVSDEVGQPLSRISVVTIPNGLLLTISPGYLRQYPSLFYPGKDDKGKNPLKVRCRVDFELLKQIDAWRVVEFSINER